MATMGESGPRLSVDDFARLYESVKNWGRWGAADQRGTLNYVTRERTVAAAALVRSGRTVSLSLPLNTVAGPDNPRPALHYMTHMGDREPGEPGGYGDFIGLEYHGNAHTHVDALCHATYRGQFYNGVPASSVTSAGAAHGAITIAEHGVVTRGVLLDIPRLLGVTWLEHGTAVHAADLEAAEAAQGVRVGEGDVLVVRNGHHRRRLEEGPWVSWEANAGLHPGVATWLHGRRVAVLGTDCDAEVHPSVVDGSEYPIHALAIPAMGMPILDNLQLEELAAACEEEGRWEFQSVIAPLRLERGTGSPCNPIAIF